MLVIDHCILHSRHCTSTTGMSAVTRNSSVETVQTARMLLYIELKWFFSPKSISCSHRELFLPSFFVTALWIIEAPPPPLPWMISLTTLSHSMSVTAHPWLPPEHDPFVCISLKVEFSESNLAFMSFSRGSLEASREMGCIWSWQTFSLKTQ